MTTEQERAPRKVMMSPELMEQWATRDAFGNRLVWNWRQPDADGWWEPVITRDESDNLVAAERARLAEAVRALTGYDLTVERESIAMPDFGTTKRHVQPPPITLVVTTTGGGTLIDRAAVLALLEPEA